MLHQTLLTKFCATQADAMQLLSTARAAGASTSAQRSVHTLAGCWNHRRASAEREPVTIMEDLNHGASAEGAR